MCGVDAISLSPGESVELAELRRRAYGTPAGIAEDPVAQARLDELENATRNPSTAPEPSGPEAAPPRDPAESPSGLCEAGAATSPASHPRRRVGTVFVAVVTALAGAVLTAWGLSAASGTAVDPAPTSGASAPPSLMSLGAPFVDRSAAPDPSVSVDSLVGGAAWARSAGFDVATMQGYRTVDSITPWTATRSGGREHCVLLDMNNGTVFSHMGCATAGRIASVGIPVTVTSADGSPHDIILLFMDTGGDVEVRAVNPW